MKFIIRSFFKLVRLLLGPLLLAWEWISTPKGIVRSAAEQAAIDARTAKLVLYQYKTCPFCIKVRRQIAWLSLKIELRDAQRNPQYRQELEQQGGKIKVPCLRITDADNKVRWLYESDAINQYLEQLVA